MYIYQGEPTGLKGRPKKYDGKVDKNALNMNYFVEDYSSNEIKIFSATVYCKAFKRDIKLAVAIFYKEGKEIAENCIFQQT